MAQTDGHGDSMTNSAQRGRVGEKENLVFFVVVVVVPQRLWWTCTARAVGGRGSLRGGSGATLSLTTRHPGSQQVTARTADTDNIQNVHLIDILKPWPQLKFLVDREVSEWRLWSLCSRSCGEGIRERTRDVETQPKGKGKDFESQSCNEGTCPGIALQGTRQESVPQVKLSKTLNLRLFGVCFDKNKGRS